MTLCLGAYISLTDVFSARFPPFIFFRETFVFENVICSHGVVCFRCDVSAIGYIGCNIKGKCSRRVFH